MEEYTDAQLKAEILHREQARYKAEKPALLAIFDIDDLEAICQQYIDELYNTERADDDLKQYIFEAAIEAFFGKGIWGWVNARLK